MKKYFCIFVALFCLSLLAWHWSENLINSTPEDISITTSLNLLGGFCTFLLLYQRVSKPSHGTDE